ncbi:MAG: PAS domain-containing sensor histidine kinase [Methylophaga sp.]|nr:MAG: PAS domain-containing sensor histidine kinase [Methylophaga sp.]
MQTHKPKELHLADLSQLNTSVNDETWIEVIQHMDAIYSDLVHSQVELENKNAELEETRLFIESILSAMHNILVVTNTEGQILRVNLALEKLTGKTSSELQQQPLSVLFATSASSVKQSHHLAEKIRAGTLLDCEIDILSTQNKAVPMAVTSKAHYDHTGRLLGAVLTGRPLGEIRLAYLKLKEAHEKLKTTQQQLIQSEKMASLGRLIAGVAHELNNPISFVFGNMYALQRYEKRLQQYLESIHQNISVEKREQIRAELKIDSMLSDIPSLLEGSLEGAERVKTIVQELRRFATPGHDDNTPVDLIKLLNNALHWVSHSSKIKPTITTNMPDKLTITTNEGYVHQILINLAQNAMDAIENEQHPAIEVSVITDDDTVQITIRDNGTGISDEHMLSIFDPFFTTKPVGKGTGLGLYISYGLATEQCNGSLTAENHHEGGALFTLRLPNV